MCVCVLCVPLSFQSQCKSKFKLSLGKQNVPSIMQTRITVCSHKHINYGMCFVVLRDMWNIWNSKHLKYKQIEWDKAMGPWLLPHIPSWHKGGQTGYPWKPTSNVCGVYWQMSKTWPGICECVLHFQYPFERQLLDDGTQWLQSLLLETNFKLKRMIITSKQYNTNTNY